MPSISRPLTTPAPPAACIGCGAPSPGKTPELDAERLCEALRLLDAPEPGDLSALFRSLQELAQGPGDPVTLAAQAAARAYHLCLAPEGEVFALWMADLLLALRLRWERPAPLLATKILDPLIRRGNGGARPRPGDPDWPRAVAYAYASAAGAAHALALELSRRSEKLLTVAPQLRAKRASRVVELLLSDDCVAPSRAAKSSGLFNAARVAVAGFYKGRNAPSITHIPASNLRPRCLPPVG